MTQSSSPHEAIQSAPAGAAGQAYFSPAEWADLQSSDLHAAKVVVGLMAGIFTIGLLLYAGVFFAVAF